MLKENPSATFSDISKIIGKEWRGLSEEQKAIYIKRVNELKASNQG